MLKDDKLISPDFETQVHCGKYYTDLLVVRLCFFICFDARLSNPNYKNCPSHCTCLALINLPF